MNNDYYDQFYTMPIEWFSIFYFRWFFMLFIICASLIGFYRYHKYFSVPTAMVIFLTGLFCFDPITKYIFPKMADKEFFGHYMTLFSVNEKISVVLFTITIVISVLMRRLNFEPIEEENAILSRNPNSVGTRYEESTQINSAKLIGKMGLILMGIMFSFQVIGIAFISGLIGGK